ncbi:DNA (cytosine-5)-methyltransferase 1 [Geodermatophilus poikilotrophus]|uniref:Cytosine-specific methyltransferase n=1 Tax=Geodermatophilus poikilotrophus TaxID=1333667 RepID=A0A1I0IMJ8_9ACTN|nr:DNA (cytosine-5)-methyltransferase 1 [Geodermatophilus poikilotrophus]
MAWDDEPTDLATEPLVASRIPSTHPLHQPWQLTATERERYRLMAQRSREQSRRAAAGELDRLHEVNVPALDTRDLMPREEPNGLRALSLYSGGGGLDVSFERAGFEHVASYEILEHAAETLARNRPEWEVHGGADGDVHGVKWKDWRGKVDVLHGGPPCQPFSNAGRQQGHLDPRDCWPATVKAIRAIQPIAFVAENVPALASAKFTDYVRDVIVEPLERSRPRYYMHRVLLEAKDFGVPQVRKRVAFVGFRSKKAYDAFRKPAPTHAWNDPDSDLPRTMGVREALGLAQMEEHPDRLAPTIRSGLTGPRFTTSICNSTSAAKSWAALGLWPNGVAVTREAASAFPTDTGAFRLSVADVALIQGFPPTWTWPSAVYQAVGQIGNAVPPPLGWAVAMAVTAALSAS